MAVTSLFLFSKGGFLAPRPFRVPLLDGDVKGFHGPLCRGVGTRVGVVMITAQEMGEALQALPVLPLRVGEITSLPKPSLGGNSLSRVGRGTIRGIFNVMSHKTQQGAAIKQEFPPVEVIDFEVLICCL